MPTPVTLIPGDGIGPSIADATVRILDAAGCDIAWDRQVAGMAGVARWNDPIPDATLDSIKQTRVALKGPLETPVGEGFRSINVALRKTFDLYANVRPARTNVPGRVEKKDKTLGRENNEGLYNGGEPNVR
ncbi:MAG: isocitrate/isopropylmalate family dehydrogenase, partial [Gemmatimonas sp.]